MEALQKKHSILVEVRGKGLLIGLEYPTPRMDRALLRGFFKRGVITGSTLNNAKVNHIEQPGIIRYETIDTVIDRPEETFVFYLSIEKVLFFFLCLRTPTRPINPVEIKNNIVLLLPDSPDIVLPIRLSFLSFF